MPTGRVVREMGSQHVSVLEIETSNSMWDQHGLTPIF